MSGVFWAKLFIFFLWIIYVLGILQQFDTEKYQWRLDIVQNLCEFWAQNVLITRILLIVLDQNMPGFFMNNIYIQNIRTVWRRKLYMRTLYSSKPLWLLSIFLSDFLAQNASVSPSPKCANTPGGKMFQYSRGEYILIPSYCRLLMFSEGFL